MRVTLNLATRPFADLGPAIKRLRIAMGVLALVSILLAVGLHAIHQKAEAARARDHSLDGQIAGVTRERQGYESMMRQPDNAKLLEQAALLNGLIDDKAFSWTLAMEDLETVLPGGVQVTALEPQRSKDGRTTTLHLRVVGPRDRSIDLVRNLEHSKRFVLPRIVGETAETNERPGQQLTPVSASDRVDFEILADYTPAVPGESRPAHKTGLKAAAGEERGATARPLPLTLGVPGRVPYPGTAQHTGTALPINGVPVNGVPINGVPGSNGGVRPFANDRPVHGIRRPNDPSMPQSQPQNQPQNQPGGPQ